MSKAKMHTKILSMLLAIIMVVGMMVTTAPKASAEAYQTLVPATLTVHYNNNVNLTVTQLTVTGSVYINGSQTTWTNVTPSGLVCSMEPGDISDLYSTYTINGTEYTLDAEQTQAILDEKGVTLATPTTKLTNPTMTSTVGTWWRDNGGMLHAHTTFSFKYKNSDGTTTTYDTNQPGTNGRAYRTRGSVAGYVSQYGGMNGWFNFSTKAGPYQPEGTEYDTGSCFAGRTPYNTWGAALSYGNTIPVPAAMTKTVTNAMVPGAEWDYADPVVVDSPDVTFTVGNTAEWTKDITARWGHTETNIITSTNTTNGKITDTSLDANKADTDLSDTYGNSFYKVGIKEHNYLIQDAHGVANFQGDTTSATTSRNIIVKGRSWYTTLNIAYADGSGTYWGDGWINKPVNITATTAEQGTFDTVIEIGEVEEASAAGNTVTLSDYATESPDENGTEIAALLMGTKEAYHDTALSDPVTRVIKLDMTNPVPSCTIDGTVITDTSTDALSGIKQYYTQFAFVPKGNPAPADGAYSYSANTSYLAMGVYDVYMKARDNAGNVSEAVKASDGGLIISNSNVPTFKAYYPDGVTEYDGSSWTNSDLLLVVTPLGASYVPVIAEDNVEYLNWDGTGTVSVGKEATSNSGNVYSTSFFGLGFTPDTPTPILSGTATKTLYIDKTMPTYTIAEQTASAVKINVSDALSGVNSTSYAMVAAGTTPTDADYVAYVLGNPITIPNDGQEYDLYIYAKDNAGNILEEKVNDEPLSNGYSVTYDLNGGSGDAPVDTTFYQPNASVSVASGAGVIAPASMAFDGWKSNSDNNIYNAGNTTTDQMTMPSENVTMSAQYAKDANEDGVPDKYQKTVTFQIENGFWYDESTEKTVVLTLLDGNNNWSETGSAELTPPDKEPEEGFVAGAWTPDLPSNVSGTAPETYKYTYVSGTTSVYKFDFNRDGMVDATEVAIVADLMRYVKSGSTAEEIEFINYLFDVGYEDGTGDGLIDATDWSRAFDLARWIGTPYTVELPNSLLGYYTSLGW